MRKVTNSGISLLKGLENISSAQRTKNVVINENAPDSTKVYPYKDSGGKATIGYGNRYYFDGREVKLSDAPITLLQAKKLFSFKLDEFAKQVHNLVTDKVNTSQFDALVSFAYNVGIENFRTSALLKVVNQNPDNLKEIELQFNRWKFDDGKIVNGLVTRRVKEFDHYKKKN